MRKALGILFLSVPIIVPIIGMIRDYGLFQAALNLIAIVVMLGFIVIGVHLMLEEK